MSVSVICPSCKTKNTVADDKRGKRVRCKRCKHLFVVGAPRASAPENDLAFEDDSEIRPRGGRREKSRFAGVLILFVVMFGLGGGATAGLLWWTKPDPEEAPPAPEKPPRFTS